MHPQLPGQRALRFAAARRRQLVPLGDHPVVILERGSSGWDDYGYKTFFEVFYYDPAGSPEPRSLGAVKILQRDAKVTQLATTEMDLRKLAEHLAPDVPGQHELWSES